ncbi:MAG: phosphotransferase [Gammaproteobacteria bacterium]|nr:phosphotransferase [Gammaproteobacteria bacterium]
MTEKPYSYTRLSSDEAARLVQRSYSLTRDVRCQFYTAGLHDNYLVEDGNDRYILRVYRNGWRSKEEIGFELALIAFLNQQSTLLARLVPDKDGNLSVEMDAPEGKRYAALFQYADGEAPGKDHNAEEAEILGETVAQLHHLADDFKTEYKRSDLELPYLLDQSITRIEPFIDEDDLDYLKKLQAMLHHELSRLTKSREIYGICSGDVNAHNFHITLDDRITLFDFDQCGYGFRAFEIAKYFSSLYKNQQASQIREAFLRGYQKVRILENTELATIPYFEIVAVIWVMAIHVDNGEYIGHKHLESDFWDQKFVTLRELGYGAAKLI